MEMSQPIAPQLRTAFKQYTFEALRVIAGERNSEFEVLTEVTTTEQSVSVTPIQIPAWGKIIANAKRELQALSSYNELQRLLRTDERTLAHANTLSHRSDGAPLTEEDLSRFFDWNVITRFLLNYLDGAHSCQYEDGRFSQAYRPHEEWLLTNRHTVRTIAMLCAFVGPQEALPIEQGVMLRKANDRDLSELAHRTEHRIHEFSSNRWLIEIESAVPKLSGVGDPRAIQCIQSILGAMRLTKKGAAHCTNVLTRRLNDTSQWGLMYLPAAHVPCVSQLTSDDELRAFLAFYEAVANIQPLSALEFPFRQFNYAHERTRVEDRLIDLVITLESLFVRDGGGGEVGYKFRMRLAKFLGDQGYSSLEVAEIAKNAYGMRSAIVHGNVNEQRKLSGKLKAGGIGNLDALAECVEEYARRSIQLLLQNVTAADPNRLDALLLRRP